MEIKRHRGEGDSPGGDLAGGTTVVARCGGYGAPRKRRGWGRRRRVAGELLPVAAFPCEARSAANRRLPAPGNSGFVAAARGRVRGGARVSRGGRGRRRRALKGGHGRRRSGPGMRCLRQRHGRRVARASCVRLAGVSAGARASATVRESARRGWPAGCWALAHFFFVPCLFSFSFLVYFFNSLF